MSRNNVPKNNKHRLSELTKISTIYRIKADELKSYNLELANEIIASVKNPPEEFLMVMAPEGSTTSTDKKIVMLMDIIACGHERKHAKQLRQTLHERGYLIVDPAEMEHFASSDIRSFKEDLFPGKKKVQRASTETLFRKGAEGNGELWTNSDIVRQPDTTPPAER